MESINYSNLVASIPEHLYRYILGLQPIPSDLQQIKIGFDFTQKVYKLHPQGNTTKLLQQLLRKAEQKNHLAKLLECESSALMAYFQSLDPMVMMACTLPILEAEIHLHSSNEYKRLKKGFLEKLYHSTITLNSPLSQEQLESLASYLPYQKRLALVQAQLKAFEHKQLELKEKTLEERLLEHIHYHEQLYHQKNLLKKLIKGSWWERWLYKFRSLFITQPQYNLLSKLNQQSSKNKVALAQGVVDFVKKYSKSFHDDLLHPIIPWATLNKKDFLRQCLMLYQPSLDELNDGAALRRNLIFLCELCGESAHDQEIFIQHILYHHQRGTVPYRHYVAEHSVLEESSAYDLLMSQCVKQNHIELNDFIIDTASQPNPLLPLALKNPEALKEYLQWNSHAGTKVSLQNISPLITPEIIDFIIKNKLYLILEMNTTLPIKKEILSTLAAWTDLPLNDEFQEFYNALEVEDKLEFLNHYITDAQKEKIQELDDSLKRIDDDILRWEDLLASTPLSFQMIEYLLEKIFSSFDGSPSQMNIAEILLKKMYASFISTECSQVFFDYFERLLVTYYNAKSTLFKPTSFLPVLYETFEKTPYLKTKDFLLNVMSIELSLNKKQNFTPQDVLFYHLTLINKQPPFDPQSLSKLVGLYLTQSENMQLSIKQWFYSFLTKISCQNPELILQSLPLLLKVLAGIDKNNQFHQLESLKTLAQLCLLINSVKKEAMILDIMQDWPNSLYKDLSSDLKIVLNHRIKEHLAQQGLDETSLGKLFITIHNKDSLFSLLAMSLNPNEYFKKSLALEDKDPLILFFAKTTDESLHTILKKLATNTVINLGKIFLSCLNRTEMSMFMLTRLLLILMEHLPKEERLKVRQHLIEMTQQESSADTDHSLFIERIIELSSLLATKQPESMLKARPLFKTNALAQIEYESLFKVQKFLQNIPLIESLLEQANLFISSRYLEPEAYETLSVQMNESKDSLKYTQYLVLCGLIRSIRKFNDSCEEEHSFIENCLKGLIQNSESSGIKKRATVVLKELYHCRGRGSNSHSLREPDFESGASAYSATSAFWNHFIRFH